MLKNVGFLHVFEAKNQRFSGGPPPSAGLRPAIDRFFYARFAHKRGVSKSRSVGPVHWFSLRFWRFSPTFLVTWLVRVVIRSDRSLPARSFVVLPGFVCRSRPISSSCYLDLRQSRTSAGSRSRVAGSVVAVLGVPSSSTAGPRRRCRRRGTMRRRPLLTLLNS